MLQIIEQDGKRVGLIHTIDDEPEELTAKEESERERDVHQGRILDLLSMSNEPLETRQIAECLGIDARKAYGSLRWLVRNQKVIRHHVEFVKFRTESGRGGAHKLAWWAVPNV